MLVSEAAPRPEGRLTGDLVEDAVQLHTAETLSIILVLLRVGNRVTAGNDANLREAAGADPRGAGKGTKHTRRATGIR